MCPTWPIMYKHHTQYRKYVTIALLSEKDQVMAIGDTHTNKLCVSQGQVDLEILSRTDRQTNRHAHRHTRLPCQGPVTSKQQCWFREDDLRPSQIDRFFVFVCLDSSRAILCLHECHRNTSSSHKTWNMFIFIHHKR